MTHLTPEQAKEVREAQEKRDTQLQSIGGCLDGGCVVWKPNGMHTNGGCRCMERKQTASLTLSTERNFSRALLQILSAGEEKPRPLKECEPAAFYWIWSDEMVEGSPCIWRMYPLDHISLKHYGDCPALPIIKPDPPKPAEGK